MYDSLTGIVTDDVSNIRVTVGLAHMATYNVLHTAWISPCRKGWSWQHFAWLLSRIRRVTAFFRSRPVASYQLKTGKKKKKRTATKKQAGHRRCHKVERFLWHGWKIFRTTSHLCSNSFIRGQRDWVGCLHSECGPHHMCQGSGKGTRWRMQLILWLKKPLFSLRGQWDLLQNAWCRGGCHKEVTQNVIKIDK